MSSKFKVQSSKVFASETVRRLKNRISSKLDSVKRQDGFTLLELIVTLTVIGILVMGTIPLMQNANKRQKELRLRENLRMIREAIDEFHRDTVGACPQGSVVSGNPAGQNGGAAPADPRSRVIVDDCEIFDTQNLDRYPPSLETLVEGVTVKARGLPANFQGGRGIGDNTNATELTENKDLTKVYLRELPIDPMTGEADWKIRSSYQSEDGNWDEINVFDVRSNSDGEALNGEKYSDW